MWSGDKTKTLYVHSHKTYNHQTRHSGDLGWEALTNSHFLSSCGQVTKRKRYISAPIRPITIRLITVVTKVERFPLSNSHFLWSCGHVMLRDKKRLCLLFHKTYEHQTWHSGDLGWEAAFYHFTCPFDDMVTCYYVTKQMIYLHFHRTSKHQLWQSHATLDNLVVWFHVTNKKHVISFSTRPMKRKW